MQRVGATTPTKLQQELQPELSKEVSAQIVLSVAAYGGSNALAIP